MKIETERLHIRPWKLDDDQYFKSLVDYAFVLPQNKASIQTLKRLQFQYLEPMMHANISHDLYQRPLT